MRTTEERLRDMRDAIDAAFRHLPSGRSDFEADEVVRFFLLKQVEIIGEAAFKISKDFKTAHSEIPWRKIEGTRHILVHDYFDVNWDTLWDIVTLHLEPLRKQVDDLLERLGAG
ncbi:HepT-like ribonuclease domain-containing protein [Haloferula sargassicola]|uniref:DUF86 domain-containing protein n=1 Tax=Haloferula sargassicola TaxID=490096 RepID=A0ABP9UHV6_9BACT